MRKSVLIVEIPANEIIVWDIVTDNNHTDWRSDLSKVEVLNEKEFVEYTKSGTPTKFTIEAKEPYKHYQFSFGNDNMRGEWHGNFEAVNENVTRLEFIENIQIKNPLVELISYIFFPIKKMQKKYMKDLQFEVQKHINQNKPGGRVMEEKYCQACGMPMGNSEEMYGTEKDGSLSKDYCKYCYDKGEFLFQGTMDEFIESCIPFMLESDPKMTEDQARKMMKEQFPYLKRWKEA